MPVTLPAAILYTTQQILSDDENVILQRLYDRDAALLAALTTLQNTREDLLAQFSRIDDIESRINSINKIIDSIITSFYYDMDGNGNPADNFSFFHQLISDLKSNINSINSVTAGIVRYADVTAAVTPIANKMAQLQDLDTLIKTKLDYIYGKWNVNPADDIFSL